MTHDHLAHQHTHDHGATSTAQADLLDLSGKVFGSAVEPVLAWASTLAPAPRTVVDLGAGTGAGTVALARRFPDATVVAVDRSTEHLGRTHAAAERAGVADRVRTVAADLDDGWPTDAAGPLTDAADLVWAASSLHEVADAARLLADVHAALAPGGLLVVVELDGLPTFLPDDGDGGPGLERRLHAALAARGWNSYPDWGPYLERAGFALLGRRTFAADADPTSEAADRYAHVSLRNARAAVGEALDPADRAALDALLSDAPRRGRDLTPRVRHVTWAARRP